jgi:hypothetical protein
VISVVDRSVFLARLSAGGKQRALTFRFGRSYLPALWEGEEK